MIANYTHVSNYYTVSHRFPQLKQFSDKVKLEVLIIKKTGKIMLTEFIFQMVIKLSYSHK